MRRLLLGTHFEYQVTAIFSAYSTTSQVQIIRSGSENNFKSIKVDGVVLPNVVSSYKFSKTGTHTISYSLVNEEVIGNNIFSGLTAMSSCTINEGITTIGTGAFGSCSYLASVELPSTITSIGNSAFVSCQRLSNLNSSTSGEYILPNNITYIGEYVFASCYALKNVIIPNGITSIGKNAFSGCSGLTTFDTSSYSYACAIPNTVTTVGESAFGDCVFRTLTIPESVTSIGLNPWRHCTSLSSITVDNTNTKYDSRNSCNAVIEKSTNKLVVGCKNTVIPSTVTNIGSYSFYRQTTLSSISIPTSVTSIDGNYAFYGCSGLTNVTFVQTSQLKYIGGYAFQNCYKIASIEIPSSVTGLSNSAFAGCSGLTKVNSSTSGECNLPSGLKSISSGGFSACTKLTSVIVSSTVTAITASVWEGCTGITSMTVDSNNSTYDSRNNCNAIIKTSTNELVEGCNYTVIPDSVTSIGSSAFRRCSGMTNIDIPGSVTKISTSAFTYCSGLTSVTFAQDTQISEIGNYAFSYCSNLRNAPGQSSITSIGNYAFQYCISLTNIMIPSGVTSIGTNPWYACSGLTEMFVHTGNTTYDSRHNCNAVMKTSTNELISGCKNTIISDTVIKICSNSFAYCKGLVAIIIPSGVTSIDTQAFYYCSNLENVTCQPTSPPTLGTSVFSNNKSGRKIYVPSASVNAYKTASGWSSYASYIEAIP